MKHSWQVTAFLVCMFMGAQFFGLFVTQSYVDEAASKEKGVTVWKDLPAIGRVQLERPDVAPEFSVWYIAAAIVLGTILVLILARFRSVLLWKLWFLFAVVVCMQIAFAAFMSSLWAGILALVLGLGKVFRPNVFVHNATELVLYGGLAAIFVPMLNVLYAFVLLLFLSVYDMYAVWQSKHMVKMAQFQTQSGIFAGVLLSYHVSKKKSKKSKRMAVLGGGDIGFPLIFAGSVLVASGFLAGLLVSLGAACALVGLLLFGKRDAFYPAMPFLTVGCAVGYLAALLI